MRDSNEDRAAIARDNHPPAPAPERIMEQRPIPFMGDELAAALTSGGNIYITLPGIARALGLNTQAQMRRILRTPALARGLQIIPLETPGGTQTVNCLRVDKVALWLAGIETSRVKPEFRAKIEAYQEELAPVAMQVFMRVMGLPATASAPTAPAAPDPQVAAIAGQVESLGAVASLLREQLSSLLALPAQVDGLSQQIAQAVALLESLTNERKTLL